MAYQQEIELAFRRVPWLGFFPKRTICCRDTRVTSMNTRRSFDKLDQLTSRLGEASKMVDLVPYGLGVMRNIELMVHPGGGGEKVSAKKKEEDERTRTPGYPRFTCPYITWVSIAGAEKARALPDCMNFNPHPFYQPFSPRSYLYRPIFLSTVLTIPTSISVSLVDGAPLSFIRMFPDTDQDKFPTASRPSLCPGGVSLKPNCAVLDLDRRPQLQFATLRLRLVYL